MTAMEEARLEDVGSGLAPITDGWFVVNANDAAWTVHPAFGRRCSFEGGGPALRNRPDLEQHPFPQLGIRLHLVEPGKPTGLYHRETEQEDFLVLRGECRLLVAGQERHLRAWDFFHCPAGVEHVFVGLGDEPCVVLMVGARTETGEIFYPRDELAARYDAAAGQETASPHEAYAPFGHWQPARLETGLQ
jgi:uncharacterized cupin superfamily protein